MNNNLNYEISFLNSNYIRHVSVKSNSNGFSINFYFKIGLNLNSIKYKLKEPFEYIFYNNNSKIDVIKLNDLFSRAQIDNKLIKLIKEKINSQNLILFYIYNKQ